METNERLIEDWIEQIRRFLLARLGSRGLAADLAHEAAARLLRVQRDGEAPLDPRAWLFRTARNLAVDEVRRRLPVPLGVEALGKVVDPATLPGSEPAWALGGAVVARSDLLRLLPGALDRLPSHYRRLLDAHYREGLDCQSVAARERLTVANVKVRLFRARRHLHHLLQRAALSPCS